MKILRTPEENFLNLEGYPFSPNYITVDGLRIHYVDSGQNEWETILLMHGEPSWSYLYRKMIPILTQKGFRVIAPDLVGFGKSDKPADQEDYTYSSHVKWMGKVLSELDLKNITLVCQDWGGLIGLRLAVEQEERFKRILTANTYLPTGEIRMPDAWLQFRDFSQKVKKLPIGKLIQNGCVSRLSPEVLRGYNSPYPDEQYKSGARKFPALVPISKDDPEAIVNREVWKKLSLWEKPFLTAFSDSDPIMRGADKIFQRKIPGTKNKNHTIITNAGHFLQEDKGEELGEVIAKFVSET